MERTFGDSSLLVSLTLWDTPVLFTPPQTPPPITDKSPKIGKRGFQSRLRNLLPALLQKLVGEFFFVIFRREIWKIEWEIWREFSGDCFLTHRTKTQKFWGKFRSIFRKKTSLNKEVRPFFLSDNSIWSFPSVSSLSDCSILEVLKAILALRS